MNAPAAPFQTIPEALAAWAAATPNATALITPGCAPLTYRELHAAVRSLAADFRARGLGRHDGIALLLPEGPDLSLALLAAISVGIAFPVAWPLPEGEYQRILASPHVRAAVVSTATPASVVASASRWLPLLTLGRGPSDHIADFQIDGSPLGEATAASAARPDDIAIVLRSSGTTGSPKLAPRTHRSLASTAANLSAARGVGPADRCFSPARLAHSQGITALALPIFAGGSFISASERDLAALPSWLESSAPTYFSTTPAVLRSLASDDGLREATRRTPLRCIHSTASPLPPEEQGLLEAALCAPILNGYGMSEAAGIAGEHFPRLRRVPGAVGPPWCDVRFVNDEGEPVGRHETGEIVVRGPRVFPGYLDDPEATAAAFLPGGWFRTGDLGFLDESGYLHLTGRLREVINRGGEKIFPREVDDVLRSHPAVAEAAAFRVADTRLGEDVAAAVVLQPGQNATARQLRGWMLDRLGPYRTPRRIWFVDSLPRTFTGKVQRGELTRRWSDEHR